MGKPPFSTNESVALHATGGWLASTVSPRRQHITAPYHAARRGASTATDCRYRAPSPCYPRGMTSNDLTRKQAEQLRDAIQPCLGYLSRLIERIERRGFPGDDPLR